MTWRTWPWPDTAPEALRTRSLYICANRNAKQAKPGSPTSWKRNSLACRSTTPSGLFASSMDKGADGPPNVFAAHPRSPVRRSPVPRACWAALPILQPEGHRILPIACAHDVAANGDEGRIRRFLCHRPGCRDVADHVIRVIAQMPLNLRLGLGFGQVPFSTDPLRLSLAPGPADLRANRSRGAGRQTEDGQETRNVGELSHRDLGDDQFGELEIVTRRDQAAMWTPGKQRGRITPAQRLCP
jgi:hypothetical protein